MEASASSAARTEKVPLRRRPIALLLVLHVAVAAVLALAPAWAGPCPTPMDADSQQAPEFVYSDSQECAEVAGLGLSLGLLASVETWVACTVAKVPRGKRVLGATATCSMAALLSYAALRAVSGSGPLGAVEVVGIGWLTAGLVALAGTSMTRARPPHRSTPAAPR